LNPELSQRVAELCNTRFHEAQSRAKQAEKIDRIYRIYWIEEEGPLRFVLIP